MSIRKQKQTTKKLFKSLMPVDRRKKNNAGHKITDKLSLKNK